jgi:long-chain acyl-CoA synthetase
MAETLVQLLEGAAARDADQPAVMMRLGVRSVRYTYAELVHRARCVATLLQQRGVVPGDRIAIWSPNHPDWVAAMFGAFYAGAVVVPLDVNCSRDFAGRVVGQTEPRLAFTTKALAVVLREFAVPTVEFETLELPAVPSASLPHITGETLAEVMFTSGTTGDPKGVMLTHRNIAANVESILRAIPFPVHARMLSILPLSHMFEQVGGLLCPIQMGATIRYAASRQPSVLASTMREWRPTAMAGVPQLLSAIVAGIEREAASSGRTEMLERLRAVAARLPRFGRRLLFRPVLARMGGALEFVVTGGAAVAPELQRKWEAMGVDVLEGYGATECSPVITANALDAGRVGSVGKALPGQEVHLAPDGEVLTRGENVFHGYWRNEAATAAVLDGEWYHTGDLGQWDDDGYLFLKGRKKDLIVLSDGQNVYPEDVEAALRGQPGVTDVVVLGVPRNDVVRIHAVIIEAVPFAARDAVRAANAVLDGRQQILDLTVWPEPDFPRTHTLKVRRPLVLAQIEAQVAPPTPSNSAPALDSGDALLRMIVQARGEDIAITESDTLGDDLGLDSLARVELLSVIEEDLGVYIDDTLVGPHTTVGELRALVQQREPRPRAQRLPEWSRHWPATLIRRFALARLIAPALRRLYRIEVVGADKIGAPAGPQLIISNHILHLDVALLMCAFPPPLRERVAIAAAANEIFGHRVRGPAAALLGNAFPFSKDGSGVRDSLEYLAKTLEQSWSVLIFPEGMLTVLGPMQPFKSGTGLIAVEAGIPVLPVRIDVLREGSVDRRRWLPPRRGEVRIVFGEPLQLSQGMPYAEATARLEQAVRGA